MFSLCFHFLFHFLCFQKTPVFIVSDAIRHAECPPISLPITRETILVTATQAEQIRMIAASLAALDSDTSPFPVCC